MKKYLFGVFAIALAIGFSAFTTKSNSFSTTYGINSSDATYYYVEVFDAVNKECVTQTGVNCSFVYPTSGQTQILKTDSNISSLVTGKKYQAIP